MKYRVRFWPYSEGRYVEVEADDVGEAVWRALNNHGSDLAEGVECSRSPKPGGPGTEWRGSYWVEEMA